MEQLSILLYRNFKLVTVLVAVIGTILMAGCIAPETKQPEDKSKMTIEEAMVIAQDSDCIKEGSLTDNYLYNPDTRTWWIDLEPFMAREGCNPACVVSEDTRTAEINWRCTGLKEDFCGWSTNGTCLTDLDCIRGGCSGQVCQSKGEEPIITTCIWRDCYDAEMYGLDCKCVNGHCHWSEMGFLEGKVTIGPICPVEREGIPCEVDPKIYEARKIIVYAKDKTSIIKVINLDENGNYRAELIPSVYVVDINYVGIDRSSDVPKEIKIESGHALKLNIDIDTGIR